MVDISGLLDRKYSIEQQNADTQRLSANANANLANTTASVTPLEAEGRAAAGFGAGAAGQGQGAYYGALAGAEPGIAGSRERLEGSETATNQYQLAPASSEFLKSIFGRFNQGGQTVQPFNKGTADVEPNGYKSGKTKVPGKGDGKTDTVPSMLAPGEAVLNKAAAEHLGRDTIGLLNAIGEVKMGMDGNATSGQGPVGQADPSAAGGQPGYATGTTNVPEPVLPIPGPGQGQGGGTWTPGGGGGDTGKGGQNQTLRAGLGMGVPRPGFAMGTENVGASGAGETQGYAKGTEKVPAKAMGGPDAKGGAKAAPKGGKAGPAPAAIPHGILSALLRMHGHGGGGAGMPPAGLPGVPQSTMVGQTPPQMGGGATRLPIQGGGQ